MPFQNLHRRSQSKGTFISKSHTYHCDIKYSSDMLSIYNLISLKLLITAVIYTKMKENQKFCDNWTLCFSSSLTWRQPPSRVLYLKAGIWMYNPCQITTMACESWACKFRPYLPGLTQLQLEKKTALKPLFSSKVWFLHFWAQKLSRDINLQKHHLTLVHWNAHIWAKIHFNIISAKSEKMKLKSGHLELRFCVLW